MQPFNLLSLTSTWLLLFCLQIHPAWARVDTLRTFPEKRFINGGVTFEQYMMKNLRYPAQAQQAATVGTSLISFVLTPTGKLTNVAIVNSVGEAIDSEVLRLIHTTKKLWLPADKAENQDSVMMFLPISFQLSDVNFYVEPVKPDFILNEIVVIGYSSPTRTDVKDDEYYITQLTSASQKKEYKQMLKMVNELIRRNPYSDKLYLQRANIEQQLGQPDEACRDFKKIIYFLGRTSFPKKFIQNCPESPMQVSSGTTSAQKAEQFPIEEEIFTVCEVPPSFPGGAAELDNFIRQNLRYPQAALNKKAQGDVFLSFIITKEGSIRDINILKDIGFGTNEETVRLVQSMPNWNPGKQSGRPVHVKYTMFIPFRLSDAK